MSAFDVSVPLSEDELARLDALDSAATPGPWEADGTEVSQHWSRPEPWLDIASNEVSCMAYCYGGQARGIERDEDAEFIAFARDALPRLVAEVRAHRAREAENEWEYALMATGDDEPWSDYYGSREALSANLDALAARDDQRLVRRQAPGRWEPVEDGEEVRRG